MTGVQTCALPISVEPLFRRWRKEQTHETVLVTISKERRAELETERQALNVMRTLLTRSCCETAPSTLQERIAHQLHELQLQELAGFTQTEIITQYRRTEITIDGETQIEIETSHEIRRDFPF